MQIPNGVEPKPTLLLVPPNQVADDPSGYDSNFSNCIFSQQSTSCEILNFPPQTMQACSTVGQDPRRGRCQEAAAFLNRNLQDS